MSAPAVHLLREIPSVDRLLKHNGCEPLLRRYNREYLREKCRTVLDDLRSEIRAGNNVSPADLGEEAVLQRVADGLACESRPRLVAVVNATGTVLHTNLGRAVLPSVALEALALAGGRTVNLEYDVSAGKRGRREHGVDKLLIELTGAESATVVNNNAAAVLLCLNTLAEGREVIVSRGELIEIGGSFRIPEIMAKSGAVLREVGSTNRTHPEDYERAIGANTALLLKVHTSNYKVVGFTAEVELDRLVELGQKHRIPVMEDLGSGALVDLSRYGLPKEPLVGERIRAGADVVTFSGDKVLGGPQAGLIAGRKSLIDGINRNHLQRALRCGKLTLAALEATLRLYRESPNVTHAIPTLRAFVRPVEEIRRIGEGVLPRLKERLGQGFDLSLEDSTAQIGSGALPTEELPTVVIAIEHPTLSATSVAEKFRSAAPPIIGRIKDDRFLLDLRTIFDPAEIIPDFCEASDDD